MFLEFPKTVANTCKCSGQILRHLQMWRPENTIPISCFQAVRIKLPHFSLRQPQMSVSQAVFTKHWSLIVELMENWKINAALDAQNQMNRKPWKLSSFPYLWFVSICTFLWTFYFFLPYRATLLFISYFPFEFAQVITRHYIGFCICMSR